MRTLAGKGDSYYTLEVIEEQGVGLYTVGNIGNLLGKQPHGSCVLVIFYRGRIGHMQDEVQEGLNMRTSRTF